MRDIGRRLNTIEKRLRVSRESRIRPPILSSHIGRGPTPEDEERLGPAETWITYQEQLQAQEKANGEYLEDHSGCVPKVIVISLNADEECRRRSERECQTLSED